MQHSDETFSVVVTDYVEPDLSWEAKRYADADVDFRCYQMRDASASELINIVANCDVLVMDQSRIDAEVIRGLNRCRLIIRHGDGFDNLDIEAATEAGIVCINEPGFWTRKAAEQSLALALCLAFRLPIQQEIARSPIPGVGWDYGRAMPYNSLGTLTAGVIGGGRIGRELVSLLAPIVQGVLVYDPHIDAQEIVRFGGEPATLERLAGESDIISIHAPANAETVGMVNAELLSQTKKGALLVNAARGSIVDTDALIQALESGHLAGAALDSTDPEPLPSDHPLFGLKNVIITPHMCWYSEDAMWAIRKRIVNDVLGALSYRIPETVVNTAVLKSVRLRFKEQRETRSR